MLTVVRFTVLVAPTLLTPFNNVLTVVTFVLTEFNKLLTVVMLTVLRPVAVLVAVSVALFVAELLTFTKRVLIFATRLLMAKIADDNEFMVALLINPTYKVPTVKVLTDPEPLLKKAKSP